MKPNSGGLMSIRVEGQLSFLERKQINNIDRAFLYLEEGFVHKHTTSVQKQAMVSGVMCAFLTGDDYSGPVLRYWQDRHHNFLYGAQPQALKKTA